LARISQEVTKRFYNRQRLARAVDAAPTIRAESARRCGSEPPRVNPA
jgi:hypothetical protein